jgi:hypothetical protein
MLLGQRRGDERRHLRHIGGPAVRAGVGACRGLNDAGAVRELAGEDGRFRKSLAGAIGTRKVDPGSEPGDDHHAGPGKEHRHVAAPVGT